MAGDVERDFFGGSVRLHILHHAARAEVFGQGLIDELQRHGYRLSPGTLYPILHKLERGGYLQSSLEQAYGRRRRMYITTPAGTSALAHSRSKILALCQEILGDSVVPAETPRTKRSPRLAQPTSVADATSGGRGRDAAHRPSCLPSSKGGLAR
jgi:PadR family transcriptional regulator PadR